MLVGDLYWVMLEWIFYCIILGMFLVYNILKCLMYFNFIVDVIMGMRVLLLFMMYILFVFLGILWEVLDVVSMVSMIVFLLVFVFILNVCIVFICIYS